MNVKEPEKEPKVTLNQDVEVINKKKEEISPRNQLLPSANDFIDFSRLTLLLGIVCLF